MIILHVIIKKLNFLKLIIILMSFSKKKLKNIIQYKIMKEKKRYLMILYNKKKKVYQKITTQINQYKLIKKK